MTSFRAIERELARLEKNEPDFAKFYKRAYDTFIRITREATGQPDWQPGSKEASAFFNAAVWEWFHHVWIVDRADGKKSSDKSDYEKG